jgi:hypothetical protein
MSERPKESRLTPPSIRRFLRRSLMPALGLGLVVVAPTSAYRVSANAAIASPGGVAAAAPTGSQAEAPAPLAPSVVTITGGVEAPSPAGGTSAYEPADMPSLPASSPASPAYQGEPPLTGVAPSLVLSSAQITETGGVAAPNSGGTPAAP